MRYALTVLLGVTLSALGCTGGVEEVPPSSSASQDAVTPDATPVATQESDGATETQGYVRVVLNVSGMT